MFLSSRRTGIFVPALLFFISLVAGPVVAANWWIEPDGSGDLPTIQTAIDAAADGDSIKLADGTFAGPGNWDLQLVGRDLVIISASYSHTACVIDCYEFHVQHRAFLIDGGAPSIAAIGIVNGAAELGAGARILAGSPVFTGCRFEDGHATQSGGAIHVATDGALTADFCTFANNNSNNNGGAVYLSAATTSTFFNCVFENNDAVGYGGAVQARACTADFTNCHFLFGYAGTEGGGVYASAAPSPAFTNCRFVGSQAVRGGGLACTTGAIPTITRCTFLGNIADEGGAVSASGGATPSFGLCTFLRNVGNTTGGVFRCDTTAGPIVENCLLAWSESGEAYADDGTSTPSFSCSDIYGNAGGDWTGTIAGQLGGDGNIWEDPQLCQPRSMTTTLALASPCLAVNNPACGQIGYSDFTCDHPEYTVTGAGMASPGMFPTIQAAIDHAPAGAGIWINGMFTGDGNRDLDFGGKDVRVYGQDQATAIIDCEGTDADRHRAFEFHSGETTAATVENLTIRNGWGGYHPYYDGGGMIIRNGSSPTIHNVHIENCTTSTSGAGIAVRDSFTAPVITGCVFEGNYAETAGGGIWAAGPSTPLIQHCDFLANSADASGGGLSAWASLQGPLRGCRFQNNQLTDPNSNRGGGLRLTGYVPTVVDSCEFYGNTAMLGGGAYLAAIEQNQIELRDCRFESNQAELGGGLHCQSADLVTVAGVDFAYNTAGQGGGLYITDECAIFGVDLLFEGNVAETAGGGLYQDATAWLVQLDGSTFDSNEVSAAAGQGGGIWLGAESYFSGCEIRDNSIQTAGRGGGLYAATGASVGMEVCDLRLNSAQFGGGLYALQSTLALDSCWIQDNLAVYAAAAYLDGDVGSVLEFCTVEDNTAGSTGGAVLCDHGSMPLLRQCSFVGNSTGTYGAHLVSWNGSLPTVENSLFAFAPQGQAVGVGLGGDIPYFFCSDIYGNAGGDWVGEIAPQINDDANFSADPLFCDLTAGDLTLFNTSPCVPENSGCGQLVGAWPEGCVDPNTGVPEGVPAAYALEQNAPNPFNPSTRIAFALPEAATVSLTVYDAAGRRVRTLIGGEGYPAGRHVASWSGDDDAGRPAGSGVYLFRLRAGENEFLRKGVLLK